MLKNVHKSWLPLLDKKELYEIEAQLPANITPEKSEIFSFARYDLADIKAVIIGQDPYPGGQAHGLAFSSKTDIPASLRNIYKALIKSSIIKTMPKSGNLTMWAAQGIVLINTALTTLRGKTAAHVDLWREFTNMLISSLAERNPVFLLWGQHAKSKKNLIGNCPYMEYAHPSPMNPNNNFENCNHFIRLRDEFKININWDPDSINFEETKTEETDIFTSLTDKSVVIFTDGACNSKGCSYAWYIGSEGAIHMNPDRGSGIIKGTNQVAEGVAIITALEAVKNKNFDIIVIVTDSMFWIKMCTEFMPNWSVSKFDKQKNPKITKSIWKLYNECKPKLVYVKSHQDNNDSFLARGNCFVDSMAQKVLSEKN